MGQGCLAHPRDVLDQQMTAREQPHQRELDYFILASDDALHRLLHALEKVRSDSGMIVYCGFFHALASRYPAVVVGQFDVEAALRRHLARLTRRDSIKLTQNRLGARQRARRPR